jgi:hypothetical protein
MELSSMDGKFIAEICRSLALEQFFTFMEMLRI